MQRPWRALQNKGGAFRCGVLIHHPAAQRGRDQFPVHGQDGFGGGEKSVDLAAVLQAALLRHGAQIQHTGWKTHEVVGLEIRSEEHTSELQSLMRISYAVFCSKK